jgi:CarD family transcriptional regulator
MAGSASGGARRQSSGTAHAASEGAPHRASPAKSARPVRQKPELKTIPDTIIPDPPVKQAHVELDEPMLHAEDPVALDEAGAAPELAPETGEADIDALVAADIEDVVAEEDLEADLAVVPEEEEEEEDEGPPVSNRVAPRMPGHMPGVPNRPIVHARMPAKAEIFHEGDHVVYPTHGVGKVERIATEEIAGHKLELIHITFEENRMTLRVPVSKARSAGLRKLATRKMFDDAMAVLKGRARIKRTMWSRRAQEYEAKINSGDPIAIAEVVRDLHRNAGQPDQSFSERQIYEAAMDRLAAELAALDKTDKPTAVTKLGDFLKTV